ncbi:uncharacterized protein V6R79_023420 [Siganus canaliculatus]
MVNTDSLRHQAATLRTEKEEGGVKIIMNRYERNMNNVYAIQSERLTMKMHLVYNQQYQKSIAENHSDKEDVVLTQLVNNQNRMTHIKTYKEASENERRIHDDNSIAKFTVSRLQMLTSSIRHRCPSAKLFLDSDPHTVLFMHTTLNAL